MKQTGLSLALGLLLMTTACQAPLTSTNNNSTSHSHDSNTDPNHPHTIINDDEKIDPTTTKATVIGEGVPSVYAKITGATSINLDSTGNYIEIKSNGRPSQVSNYYENTPWESTMKDTSFTNNVSKTFNNETFRKSPGRIIQYSMTYKIPKSPTANPTNMTPTATSGGPIGVAADGVPFFNQYNGSADAVTSEAVSFDRFYGHPNHDNSYHYHVEPKALTMNGNDSALLGFLLDGYPVYGTQHKNANGTTTSISNSDLDTFHGHYAYTPEYPNGVYHYHVTATAPYINGSGYKGTTIGSTTYSPDFYGQTWSNLSFEAKTNQEGVKWGSADMRNATFNNSNLSYGIMTEAKMGNISMTGAILSNGILNNATMTGGNFSNAKFLNAALKGVNLINANLAGADLTGADLSNANLTGANLTGANLTNTILSNTTLTGATLKGANFSNVDLRTAKGKDGRFCVFDSYDLTGTNFSKTKLIGGFWAANLTNASFAGAEFMEYTYFTNATFIGTNLSNIDMRGMRGKNSEPGNFEGYNFTNVNFTNSNMNNINLRNANLTGANLTDAKLLGATWTTGRTCGSPSVGTCS